MYIIVLTIVGVLLLLLVVGIVIAVRRSRQVSGANSARSMSEPASDMYATNDGEADSKNEYGIMKLAPAQAAAPLPPMYDSIPRATRGILENGSGRSGSAASDGDQYVTLPSTVEVARI